MDDRDSSEERGLLLRIIAIEDLIRDQETYLAMLRIRRERMNRDMINMRRQKHKAFSGPLKGKP